MSNISNEDAEIFLERIDAICEELNRIKRGILAVQNGVPWEEAYHEEVLLEATHDENKCYALLSHMIEHLLKIKYSTDETRYNLRHWEKEVENHKKEIEILTVYGTSKPNKNLIKYIEINFGDAWYDGVKRYKKDAMKYDDLKICISLIPEECPWTFDDLMTYDIEELLSDKFFDDPE